MRERLLSDDNFNPYGAPEQPELLSSPGNAGIEREGLWHAAALVHLVGYVASTFRLLYLSYASFRLGLDVWELMKITGEPQYHMFILALVVSLYLAWLAFNETRSVNHITRQSESRLTQTALWAGLVPLSFTAFELLQFREPGLAYINLSDAILSIVGLVLWYVAAIYRLRMALGLPPEDAKSPEVSLCVTKLNRRRILRMSGSGCLLVVK